MGLDMLGFNEIVYVIYLEQLKSVVIIIIWKYGF